MFFGSGCCGGGGNVDNAEKLGFKRHGVSENMTKGMWPQA